MIRGAVGAYYRIALRRLRIDIFAKQARISEALLYPSMPVNHVTRTEINIGDRAAPLIVRVNRRAKQLILKVDPYAGEILVTAPSKRAMREAIAFARERAGWIAAQLDEGLRARPFAEDLIVPYLGEPHVIRRSGSLRAPVRVIDGPPASIHVGGDAAHLNRRILDWMKREARKALTARVDDYCARLGKNRRSISVRDTRTRWGSCSSDGTMSFSWRLIMAPPAILDYVAAHECVHLMHMNHSAAFWRRLAALGVDSRGAETWLDARGAALFSYGAANC